MLAHSGSRGRPAEVSDSELYFLIATFLQTGPCHRAARELQAEVHERGLLPNNETVDRMRLRYSCPPDQLRRLLRRLLDLTISETPRGQRVVTGGVTLGGRERAAPDASLLTMVGIAERVVPQTLPISQFLRQRELRGRAAPLTTASAAELSVGASRFGLRGIFEGHKSAAYCVVFDAVGERVFTGADDNLVKMWGFRSCLLQVSPGPGPGPGPGPISSPEPSSSLTLATALAATLIRPAASARCEATPRRSPT